MSREYPRAWLLVSAAWIGPAVLAAFETYMQARLGNRPPVTSRMLLWQGGDWLIYALLTPVVFRLGRRFPLKPGKLVSHVPIHFLASIVLCAAWAAGGIALGWWLLQGVTGRVTGGFTAWFFTSLPFGVAVYFAVLGIEHGLFYLTQASRLSAQLAEARLGALRMQMHPHFLFNSLNAITVVVRDRDTRTATRMLEQLGEVLHQVMRTDRPQEVPLSEEIDFLKQYLALEQVRFSDRLRPVFEIDPAVMRAKVPDFVLQPLVENALRHGLARRVEATLLRIGGRRDGPDLVLSVTDDGPGPQDQVAEAREGVGLANTRERLATLYGGSASLELKSTPAGGAVATVRIPYREPAKGPVRS